MTPILMSQVRSKSTTTVMQMPSSTNITAIMKVSKGKKSSPLKKNQSPSQESRLKRLANLSLK